ncbi:type III pantothenate kinase [Methylotenera sp. G11]|uniref:type III pantothenate kinase n=1 Tax=Methylotenera sp. G11 TaxID=1506585 RepID=UPI000645F27C|nr:type III pantothenate kinase [Methylotenera sp. G11]
MLLTIDAGNTRTKWAVFNRNGEITHNGVCANDQLAGIDLSPRTLGYERVIISNVAGKVHASRLEKLLASHHQPVLCVTASPEACNVINGYAEPETLGTDRWAALIAAWHSKHTACVVVNAGTAVTVDALHGASGSKQQGEFLGGMILPGIRLMQASLGVGTAQLPLKNAIRESAENTPVNIFAKSTAQAMDAGALNAITGAVERMAAALEAQCWQTPFIILSGGDADVIQHHLTDRVTNPTVIIDNLVLNGLYLLDYFNQTEQPPQQ